MVETADNSKKLPLKKATSINIIPWRDKKTKETISLDRIH